MNSVPGTIVWNELNTHDAEQAKRFYSELLGWSFVTVEENDYIVASKGDTMVAGILDLSNLDDGSEIPPSWFTYIEVENIDDACVQVVSNGGKITRPTFEVPGVGRIAIVQDNTGACLGIMQSSEE